MYVHIYVLRTYVCMCVYIYIRMYICVCIYVCVYVCIMYVCFYVFMYFFIKHAPLQWSNTTCCNYTCYWFSFVYRGCRVQPQYLPSLYNLKQYTARINPVHLGWNLFSSYIYIYPIITDQSPLIL